MTSNIFSGGISISKYKTKKRVDADHELRSYGFFEPPFETAMHRYSLYKRYYKAFEDNIDDFQLEWREEIIKDLVDFVSKSARQTSDLLTVPIGFLVTGLDNIESNKIFEAARKKIVEQVSPFISIISSKDASNSKLLFQNFVKQVVLQSKDNEKNPNLSAQDLKAWYENETKQKSDKKRAKPKPIVVVIEDLDIISTNVVQEFFMILSCAQIPYIFIIGVAYSSTSFDKYLPTNSPFSFQSKVFQDISARDKIEIVIKKILLVLDSPFLLSGDLIKYMKEYFLNHSFSIHSIKKFYQACMLDYFASKNSALCLNYDKIQENGLKIEDLKTTVKDYPELNYSPPVPVDEKEDTMTLRRKGQVDNRIKNGPIKFENIKYNLGNYHAAILDWFGVLNVLYSLSIKLPQKIFGESFSDLFILCSNGDLFKRPENVEEGQDKSPFDKFLNLIDAMFKEGLLQMLKPGKKSIDKFISNCDNNEAILEKSHLPEIRNAICDFIKRLQESDKEESQYQIKKSPTKKFDGTIKKTMEEVRKDLKTNIAKKEGTFVIKIIREEFKKYIAQTVKDRLNKISSIQFSDIFLFDNIGIRRRISGNPAGKINTALMKPFSYLNCQCCETIEITGTAPTLPDASIMYKILLEQTCLIANLNLLFEPFKSIISSCGDDPEQGSSKRKKRKPNQEVEDHFKLRFRHATGQLQHMGYIKRLKRNPDEIERVTFDQFFGYDTDIYI